MRKAVQSRPVRLLFNPSLSLFMKKAIAVMFLLPILLGPIATIVPTNTALASSRIGKPTKYGPWQFSVQSLRSHGRTMKNPFNGDDTLEASGHWVFARVRVTNKSNSRQSAKNLILAMGSTIVSSKGKSYELDYEATGDINEELEKRPFNPGESREINLFFDTPTTETFKRLEIVAMKSMANIKIDF